MADVTFNCELIEKEIINAEIIEKELIGVKLDTIDIIPHTKTLSDLSDINISNPIDKDLLTFDALTETWKNKPFSETELSKIILNETPTKLTSKRFQTANNFRTGTLVAYLNGIKEKQITIIDSTKFEFKIDTIIDDTIEVSYIKV